MPPTPFWAKPRFVLVALLLHLAAHLAIRMAMGHALGVDDAEQALLSQRYTWAYRYKESPLFNWAVVTIGHLIPVNAFSLGLLRYAFLGVLYGFVYLAAQRLLRDPRLSALSVYSFAAINPFAEASHRDLTHSTALSAMTAVTWYIFVRLAASPTLGWYLMLGAAFALGMLAKWNFVILAVSLPLACLVNRGFRHLILTWKIVPAGLLTTVMVLPTVLATFDMEPPELERVKSIFESEGGHSLTQVVHGTLKLADVAIIYALPFLPIAVILFALPLWRGVRAGALQQTPAGRRPDAALIGMTIAIGLAILWAIVLFAGATEFKVRYLYPILLILPLWLLMVVEAGRPAEWAISLFAVVMVALVIFVGGKRIYGTVEANDCGLCAEWQPYDALAAELTDAGYDGRGTIVTHGAIGANMRAHFPHVRVVDPDLPIALWPPASGDGQCLLLAQNDGKLAGLGADLKDALNGDPEAPHRDGALEAPMHPPIGGTFRLSYRLYAGPTGDCR